MIQSFRHKGLRRFFETGVRSGIQPNPALETAIEIEDMAVPGFGLHPLKGDRKGRFAVSVSGNWRMTFAFADGNAREVDYEDYH